MEPEPPILAALDAAAVRHATPCGTGTLAWRAWNERAARTVVLLHGGAGSWRHWVHQIPWLAARHRVLAPDLPGLGDSAAPPVPRDARTVAGAVAAGLAAMLRPGAPPPDLAGFSFGAMIGGMVAAARPVRRLVLVGAGGLGGPSARPRLVPVLGLRGAALEAAHRANLMAGMLADPARLDALALAVQAAGAARARLATRPLSAGTWLAAALPRVAAPVLAVWGTRDAFAPDPRARAAALRSLRPDAAVHLLEGAGHWAMHDAPAAFDAVLAGFLDAT